MRSSIALAIATVVSVAAHAEAQDCSVPHATRYPVAGPVNGGWDPTLEAMHDATYDCEGTWSNSDYVAGTGSSSHHGNDFFAAFQTPIVAVTDGVVAKAGWETGLGNRVAIHDDCGWEYDAGHMDAIAPGIAVGVTVHAGDVIGFMGATGANSHGVVHLHFNIHFAAQAWADDTDPFPVVGPLAATSCSPVGAGGSVEGWVDGADCSLVSGWTRDRARPDQRIVAGVSIDGARFDVSATVDRGDLCAPLGACNYGFELFVPRSFLDGAPHVVAAVGASAGVDTALSGGPITIQCAPPALEPDANVGVRRYVTAAAFAAWRFEGRDVLAVGDAVLARYASGRDWPEAASLVEADGAPAVYAIDGATRRWITSGRSLVAGWHMGWDVVRITTQAEIDGYAEAAALSERPLLVRGSGPEVYVIDVRRADDPAVVVPTGDAGAVASADAAVGVVADAGVAHARVLGGDGSTMNVDARAGASGGCSVSAPGQGARAWGLAWVVMLGLVALARRRGLRGTGASATRSPGP